MPAEFDD